MNTTGRRCYLFTLEVDALEVGKVYHELPLHCTLMPRFWTDMPPEVLADKVQPLFKKIQPIVLTAYERTVLGPQQKNVSLIKLTPELDKLNMQLYQLLNELSVTYNNPEWVGEGHIFHVTDQKGAQFKVGSEHVSNAIHLIEVKVPGMEHSKAVRERFGLA